MVKIQSKPVTKRLLLLCNESARIEEVLLDEFNILTVHKLPFGAHSIISPSSLDAFGRFWLEIIKHKVIQDKALLVLTENSEIELNFSGYRLKDKIVVSATNMNPVIKEKLKGLAAITNEQQNHIRRAEKELAKLKQGEKYDDLKILDEYSKLNNELVNTKRELIQTNAETTLLNKKLQQANEHMEMFSYSISHDLKEPARMVKSFLTLFVKNHENTLDEQAKTYLGFAIDGANRMQNMINELVVYYQSSVIDSYEPTDLNEILKEVEALLKLIISDKNAEIQYSDLPVINSSKTAMRQIFLNLISNALKFTPSDRKPVIKIDVTETARDLQISVTDNGIGIPENSKKNIFRLFHRLNDRKDYDGTGMGLAIVEKLVSNLNGKIWLESKEGEGTVFFYKL